MLDSFRIGLVGSLSVASAIPLIALGLLVLAVRRTPQNLFFALFAVTWGLQVATANLARITTDAMLHDHLFRTTLFLYLATALFLFHFASLHPMRNRIGSHPAGAFIGVLAVLPGALFLLFAPDRIFETVIGDGPAPVYGPLIAPFVFAPFFLAFYYAAWTQAAAAREGETATGRQRARLVAMALSFFLSYIVSLSLVSALWPTAHDEVQSATAIVTNAALYALGGLLIVFLLGRLVLRRDRDWSMIAAIVVPAGFAALQRVVAVTGIELETGWFWRFAAVGLLAYAIARYQLFDLDVRFHRAVLAAVPLGVAALSIAVFLAVLDRPPAGWLPPAVFVLALTGNVSAWRYRDRLADRFLLLGDSRPDQAYRTHRRYEVYRDALVGDGGLLPAGHPTLRRLRRRLDLTDREHLALADQVARELGRAHGAPRSDAPYPGYRIDRPIGEGSHGRALLAVRESDRAAVVLKVVGRQALGGVAVHRLRSEAGILARLDHPHIVRLHDVFETRDEVVLVLDHAAGGDLASRLAGSLRISSTMVARWADQLLGALAAAHEAGVLHRDLKPENVLLDAEGAVLLADFGVATHAGPDATVLPGLAGAGTLLYMAPEQVRGLDSDPRADLYSVGALLYRIVTGQHHVPVAGRDDFQVRRLILEAPPRLEALPPEWRPVLHRALQKDPDARFPDARSFRAALHEHVPAAKP